MRGYIGLQINFIKQWRNRTAPLVQIKSVLMHQISNVLFMVEPHLVKKYLIIEVYN